MKLMEILKRVLPANIVHHSSLFYHYGYTDMLDYLLGRRLDLVPPKRMIFIGGQDFVEVGDEFLGHFRELGGLRPNHAVLDIGSGVGRMARPLTGFLGKDARYEGFDIVERGVAWCTSNITRRYPNFHFQVSDIYNKFYRPNGKTASTAYVFPYPDSTFDFAFATSVFTHMFPADIRHYVSELARVLKPGGKALLTFFLWNDSARHAMEKGAASFTFVPFQDFWVANPTVPEDISGMPEEFVKGLFEQYGLRIEEPIRYGKWRGDQAALSFQDLVVVSKPA